MGENTEEKSGSQSPGKQPRKRSLARLLASAAVLLFVFVVFLFRSPQSSKVLHVRGIEVATDTGAFLSNSLTDQGTSYAVETCAGELCSLEMEVTLPVVSWKIMAYAALYKATSLEKYRLLFEREFRQVPRETFDTLEQFIGPQIYEAYRLTGNLELLDYFFKNVEPSWLWSAKESRKIDEKEKQPLSPMIAGALAKQLLDAAGILNDASLRTVLRKRNRIPADDLEVTKLRDDLIDNGRYWLSAIDRQLDETPPENVLPNLPELKQDSCWLEWVRYSLYTATGDDSHLHEIDRFLDRANFLSHEPSDIRFVSLQSIFPCIHLLHRLSDHRPTAKEEARSLLEGIVLPLWDSPRRKLCSGSNGLLALTQNATNGEFRCSDNGKYASDAAWATYLFSQHPDLLEVAL